MEIRIGSGRSLRSLLATWKQGLKSGVLGMRSTVQYSPLGPSVIKRCGVVIVYHRSCRTKMLTGW